MEKANSINEFINLTKKLECWLRVLEEHENLDEKNEIIIEFVNPIATLAICIPYAIRSRFIFSVSHLCHQANRQRLGVDWKDDFPLDSEVYAAEMDRCGKEWRKYIRFKVALEKVSNKKYQLDTLDFRSKYNHRISPRIEIGITNIVIRRVSASGKVSYGFGGSGPLLLKNLVPLLKGQCKACAKAFSLFQELVNEQIAAIAFS